MMQIECHNENKWNKIAKRMNTTTTTTKRIVVRYGAFVFFFFSFYISFSTYSMDRMLSSQRTVTPYIANTITNVHIRCMSVVVHPFFKWSKCVTPVVFIMVYTNNTRTNNINACQARTECDPKNFDSIVYFIVANKLQNACVFLFDCNRVVDLECCKVDKNPSDQQFAHKYILTYT